MGPTTKKIVAKSVDARIRAGGAWVVVRRQIVGRQPRWKKVRRLVVGPWWVAATAVALNLELVAGDGTFENVAGMPPSDANDRDSWSNGVGDRLEVVLVGGEDSAPTPMSSRDDVDIDDIGRARSPGERADVVCFVVAEWHDVAAPQKAPQLSLSA